MKRLHQTAAAAPVGANNYSPLQESYPARGGVTPLHAMRGMWPQTIRFATLPTSNAKGIAGGVGEQCSPTKKHALAPLKQTYRFDMGRAREHIHVVYPIDRIPFSKDGQIASKTGCLAGDVKNMARRHGHKIATHTR